MTCVGGEVKTYGEWLFCYSHDTKNYDDAKAFCQGNGLELVEPITPTVSEAVNRACADIGGNNCTWISLTC